MTATTSPVLRHGPVTKRAILDWVRDDAPLTVQMSLRPEHIDSLLSRLAQPAAQQSEAESTGGLRPSTARPTRCYCPPDRCDAPVVMGRKAGCLRAHAAQQSSSPSPLLVDGLETVAWRDVKDAPQDGTEILLNHRTHGIIQGWFSKGEWSDDTPMSPREYSGDMWILGDDLYQDEVEFGEHKEVVRSGVLGWLPLSELVTRQSAADALEAAKAENVNANKLIVHYASRATRAEAEAADLRKAARRVFDEKRPGYHDCIDAGEPQCAWCDLEEALAAHAKEEPAA